MNRPQFKALPAIALLVATIQVGALVLPLVGPVVAAAQSATELSPLMRATEFYRTGRWDEAIRELQEALKGEALQGQERIEAQSLLARSLVRAGREGDAIGAFHAVLDLNVIWRPDPDIVTPEEQAVFEKALATWTPPVAPLPTAPEKKPLWKNPWMIGGGVVALAAVVVLAASSSKDGNGGTQAVALPLPPYPPTGRARPAR